MRPEQIWDIKQGLHLQSPWAGHIWKMSYSNIILEQASCLKFCRFMALSFLKGSYFLEKNYITFYLQFLKIRLCEPCSDETSSKDVSTAMFVFLSIEVLMPFFIWNYTEEWAICMKINHHPLFTVILSLRKCLH